MSSNGPTLTPSSKKGKDDVALTVLCEKLCMSPSSITPLFDARLRGLAPSAQKAFSIKAPAEKKPQECIRLDYSGL